MNNRTLHNRISSIAIALVILGISSSAKAAPGEVLILDSTVTGGLDSAEALRITELGLTPVLVDSQTWAGMSTADFSDYEAIVLGDPSCGGDTSVLSAAQANAAIWAAAVDGNVMVLGTDPVWHINYGPFLGPQALNDNALGFVLADAGTGATGAYITMSCYYHFSPPTVVPVLSGFGPFELQGAQLTGALNNAHIVAEHPSLDNLTDAALANWNNSVHENFLSWPNEFEVLALALDDEGGFVAGDGSLGFPYLLARGVIPSQCGDGSLDPAEECDDGNNEDGDGCDAACNAEFIERPPVRRPPRQCPEAPPIPLLGGDVELSRQSPNVLPDRDPEADLTDTLQVSGCSLGDAPGNGPAWAFLGLMLAAIGRRRRS